MSSHLLQQRDKMTDAGYILVGDSGYRTWETRENGANYYGRLLHDGIPVICGHGGSMWLCAECAEAIMAHQERENEWPWPHVPEVAR
jgi:hypothetical protein